MLLISAFCKIASRKLLLQFAAVRRFKPIVIKILICISLSYGAFYLYLSSKSAANGIAPTSHGYDSLLSTPIEVLEVELLLDHRNMSREQLLLKAGESIRSLPDPPFILGQKDGPKFYGDKSCARFPTLHDIHFDNTYWQTVFTSNGTFYLYGAYYDDRERNLIGPNIRILAMLNRRDVNVTLHCQMWFDKEEAPQLSQVLGFNLIWGRKWPKGALQPYLLGCPIPLLHRGKVPKSVSLVEYPCDAAQNNLRVQNDRPATKKGFAVCVKGLDYPHADISVRLLEWIELIGLLGADKIYFYEFAVHPNVTKVLQHYQNTGLVDVTPITLPGRFPNEPLIRHLFLSTWSQSTHRRECEVLPYNDCLYRNLYKYEYIALLDIDEVIMPSKVATWRELMDVVDRDFPSSRNCSSVDFRNVYFMDVMKPKDFWYPDAPKHLHMLQHVFRSFNYSRPGNAAKCFHRPELVVTLHNHYPMACFGKCKYHHTSTAVAQMNHYKPNCPELIKNCKETFENNYTIDSTIWRYKKELVERSENTLSELGFFKTSPMNLSIYADP